MSTRAGLAAAFVLTVGVLTVGGLRAQGTLEAALDAKSHLSAARSELFQVRTAETAEAGGEPVGLNGATDRLSRGCAEVGSAEASLGRIEMDLAIVGPALALAERAPVVGKQVQAQSASLAVGRELSAALSALCGSPVASLGGSSSGGSLETALGRLASTRPQVADAAARLRKVQSILASDSLQALDAEAQRDLQAAGGRLPELITALDEMQALLALVDTSAGPKQYLLVSQNADELRGTGGYIGTAGVLEIDHSGVRLRDFGSSRRLDTPTSLRAVPPEPLSPYLGTAYWHLAGANWTPSFPDAARQMAYFYGLQPNATQLDGVISMDQVGISLLLEATGPVGVPEYGELVSAENAGAKLHQYLHQSGVVDESQRKEFAALLSAAVLGQLKTQPTESLPKVTTVARRALEQQHLMIWTPEAEAQSVLAQRGWDGALLSAPGDALMVLENEVSSSKRSQNITRDVSYTVDLDTATPTARLDLTYSDTELKASEKPYRTFVQVYAPAGSTLLQGSATTRTDCGRTVFGLEVAVTSGAPSRVSLTYSLPPSPTAGGFQLLLQQQPNAPLGTTRVRVRNSGAEWGFSGDALSGSRLLQATARSAGVLESLPPTRSSVQCTAAPSPAVEIAQPELLSIPRLGTSAPMEHLGIAANGAMESPVTGSAVGWYRSSARPGQPGNSVFSGHVDWDGRMAVFGGLDLLEAGDLVEVQAEGGRTFRYTVEWNRSYPTNSTPLPEVLGPDGENEVLTLITCDGFFDRRSGDYLSRRFVRARLID